MASICIRVDAKSSYSGMSNVLRTVALARELSKLYYDVYFITKHNCSFVKIQSEGFNVFKITDTHALYEGTKKFDHDLIGENLQEVKQLLEKHNIGTLIIDLPFATEKYIQTARNLSNRLILIEDAPRFPTSANIVISSSLFSENIQYPAVPNQLIIKGSEYCLVDYQIADITSRTPRNKVKEIFIYINAHDRTNLVPSLLSTFVLDERISYFKFHVIVDSLYAGLKEINQLSLDHPNIQLYNMPDNILKIMLECDIAISNDLYTIYQLLGCGVPTISVLLSDPDSIYKDKMESQIEYIWNRKYIGLVNTETQINLSLLKRIYKLMDNYTMRAT